MFKISGIEKLPGLVVIGPSCIGQTSVSHCAIGVVGKGLLKAAVTLFIVKCIRPNKATVKPYLSVLAFGANGRTVGSQVKILFGWRDW